MTTSTHPRVLVTGAGSFIGHHLVTFSSSACIYPEHLQAEADVAPLKEEDAYGWEKLVAERRMRLGLLVGDPVRPGRCALICG